MTKLIPHDKAYSHDAKCKEAGDVDELNQAVTVEDEM